MLETAVPSAWCVSSESQRQSRQGHAVGAGPPRLVRGVRKQKIMVGPVIFPLKRQRHLHASACRWCGPIAVPPVRRGMATTWARMASASFTWHCASFRSAQSEPPQHNCRGCTPGYGTSSQKVMGVGWAPGRQRIPVLKDGRRYRQSALTSPPPHDGHHPWHLACNPVTSTERDVSRTTSRQPTESARRNPP